MVARETVECRGPILRSADAVAPSLMGMGRNRALDPGLNVLLRRASWRSVLRLYDQAARIISTR